MDSDSDTDSTVSPTSGASDSVASNDHDDSHNDHNMIWLGNNVLFFDGEPQNGENGDFPITDEPQVAGNAVQHDFDIGLPLKHSYLGADLEELSGCTLYDDNSIVSLPLIVQQYGTVALPGQTLPLSFFHPPTISVLRKAIEKDRTFGLVSSAQNRSNIVNGQHPLVGMVGVTAEVYEHGETPDHYRGYSIKARCRQRFKVLEVTQHFDSRTYTGRVLIIPEVRLPFILNEGSGARFKNSYQKRRLNAALTKWPLWVYDQYDEKQVIAHMKNELEVMRVTGHRHLKTNVPSEAEALSYWVAQNLPLVDSQRTSLLCIKSGLQRLRWELSFLSKCQRLSCQVCGTELAATSDTFSMSLDGPQATYVNPSGYTHETLTVKEVQNVVTVGLPSSEYSWFPGYDWRIAQCEICSSHVGWQFTSSSLIPSKFWGLSRSSIVTLAQGSLEDFRPVM